VLTLRETEGVTIFLTTHYMEEAEVADRIAIIDHGQIVALDTPSALKARVGGDVVTFQTSNNFLAAQRLRAVHGLEARVVDDHVAVEVEAGDRAIPDLIATLRDSQGPSLEVLAVNLRRPTLEDVFIKLTGRAIRDEEADSLERWRIVSRSRRS
jgi:ABC-2 type transport system ATP-binding protein